MQRFITSLQLLTELYAHRHETWVTLKKLEKEFSGALLQLHAYQALAEWNLVEFRSDAEEVISDIRITPVGVAAIEGIISIDSDILPGLAANATGSEDAKVLPEAFMNSFGALLTTVDNSDLSQEMKQCVTGLIHSVLAPLAAALSKTSNQVIRPAS